jgi:hypothetical protein
VQFSLRRLNRRLSLLDSAGDHVPVAAAFGHSMNEQNFAPDTPRHEHSYLGPGAHSGSVSKLSMRLPRSRA